MGTMNGQGRAGQGRAGQGQRDGEAEADAAQASRALSCEGAVAAVQTLPLSFSVCTATQQHHDGPVQGKAALMSCCMALNGQGRTGRHQGWITRQAQGMEVMGTAGRTSSRPGQGRRD